MINIFSTLLTGMFQTVEPPAIQLDLQTNFPTNSPQSNSELEVRWVDSIDELEQLQPEWERLAASSVWKNLSFEPYYLIPALIHLNTVKAKVLVVEAKDGGSTEGTKQIVGLVPLHQKAFRRLPLRCANVWRHDQSFDGTPLLHREYAVEAFQSIIRFLKKDKVQLFNLDSVSGSPSLRHAVVETVSDYGLSSFIRESWHRAAIIPVSDPNEYVSKHVSKSIKKTVRRLRRRLEEKGNVSIELSCDTDDYLQLAEQFLEIEASGWKGEQGTALASDESTRNFYLDLITRASVKGNARFVSMKLDGKPIAMISDLQSNGHVFSYKTAYDSAYSDYSVGLQNELQNVSLLQSRDVELADSCTDPDNERINRMWGQRIAFESLVLSLNPGLANWVVKCMPTLKRVASQIKRLIPGQRN